MNDLVYMAGPINSDSCGTYKNVHKLSMESIRVLKKMRASVYNPANDLVMGIISGELDYEDYTGNDFPMLKKANCIYFTGDWAQSKGCQAELQFAKKNNIPVFFDYWDLYDFIHRPVIITITGKSGSGKTLMADYISDKYNINLIQSYTTRQKRYASENGHTFISDEEFDQIKKEDMIAFTKFGGNRYCCKHEDVQKKNVYIIDERGLSYLRSNFKHLYKIISIFVDCDDQVRGKRVGEDRVNRDKNMFILDKKEYDYIIPNNQIQGAFLIKIDKLIKQIL